MTEDDRMLAVVRAAKVFQEAVQFDCDGLNGQGGNGGMISRDTLHKGDLLRVALLRVPPEKFTG